MCNRRRKKNTESKIKDTRNTEETAENSEEKEDNQLNLQPISDEILTYENNEETMSDEDKIILDVTENIEDCNSDPNNSDNVPETSLSDSVELNVEPMHSDIKDMDDEPAENAETEDENCDITDTLDLNESVVIPNRTLGLESFNDMSWKDNDTTPFILDANAHPELEPLFVGATNSDLTKSLRRVRLAKNLPQNTYQEKMGT